jgi:hypothetical protein
MKYIEQTARTFNTRYKEHIRDIRNNNSRYSNRMLNTGHTYGTVTDSMYVITTWRKSKHLSTLERYHIYKIYRENLRINDTHIDAYIPIFEALQ